MKISKLAAISLVLLALAGSLAGCDCTPFNLAGCDTTYDSECVGCPPL